MDELKQWLGETFYREITTTKTYQGYQSERISQGNYQYTTFELPFDVTVTETKQVLDLCDYCHMASGGSKMIPITEALDLFNLPSIGHYLIVAFVGVWALRLIYHK